MSNGDSNYGSLESPVELSQSLPPTAAELWLPEQGSCMEDSQNSIQMTAHIAVIVIISFARYYHEKDPLTKGANEKFLLLIVCIQYLEVNFRTLAS